MKNNSTHSEKIPELLAPAGTLETGIAAYESGADAVYFGLDRFNARIPAKNFELEDLSKLAAYAKRHGKRYYLTLNTLLKESELEDAVQMLEEVRPYEPSAVIVQDLGTLRLLREIFPMIPIHASTQMGIHNSAGVAMAEKLGIERVILERQVTLAELEEIRSRSKLELEVFVHGALCASLSGRCLFSSWIGGWSGNRGRCKQPCRRRYYNNQNGQKKAGFYFSTQDLYTLDLIPELIRIGVSSLKIEGRLKKANYVQSVVSAYRMMLDAAPEERGTVLKKAKQVLSGSYGRHWSHAFATEKDMQEVLQPQSVGVSGMMIGRVVGFRDGMLRLDLNRKLHIGDRIRLQSPGGDESPSFMVKSLFQGGRQVKSVTKGEAQLPVPEERQLNSQGLVYKVSQSVKRSGPAVENLPLYQPLPAVDIGISIGRKRIRAEVQNPGKSDAFVWEKEVDLQDARKHSIDPAEVRRVFSATGSDAFNCGRIDLIIEPGLFMPPSLLKSMKREFWEHVESNLHTDELDNNREGALERFQELLRRRQENGIAPPPGEMGKKEVSCSDSGKQAPKSCIRVDSLYSFSSKTREVELPHFCSQSALPVVQQKIAQAVQSGIRRFRVTDLYQFELLKDFDDLTLSVGFPFPAANSIAVDELRELGAQKVQAWIELDRPSIEALSSAASLPIEIYRYGKPFILVTRAGVDAEGEIGDPRGRKFYVEYAPVEKLTYLYPFEVLSLPDTNGLSEYWDYRHVNHMEQARSSFNFETEYV